MFLAIDTATLVSSVALCKNGRVLAELSTNNRKTHSELLLPHIQELLAMTGTARQDITGIAVSQGPGSFTGLRIGLATAKMLAYTWGIPLTGVPTLEAQALSCAIPGMLICPLLDAQKGNVYQAFYSWQEQGLTEEQPVKVIAHTELLEECARIQRKVLFSGEGALLYAQAIAAAGFFLPPEHLLISRAGSVGILGELRLKQGGIVTPVELEPIYIRRSEAEVLWEKRQGKQG